GKPDVCALAAVGPRTGRGIDYVAGTAWAMAAADLPVRGFRGVLASDLPQGPRLSSSGALELALTPARGGGRAQVGLASALALAGGEEPATDRMTLARIARRGENEHVGVACGLMDQFAS